MYIWLLGILGKPIFKPICSIRALLCSYTSGKRIFSNKQPGLQSAGMQMAVCERGYAPAAMDKHLPLFLCPNGGLINTNAFGGLLSKWQPIKFQALTVGNRTLSIFYKLAYM